MRVCIKIASQLTGKIYSTAIYSSASSHLSEVIDMSMKGIETDRKNVSFLSCNAEKELVFLIKINRFQLETTTQ